jgi:hypothetical protein
MAAVTTEADEQSPLRPSEPGGRSATRRPPAATVVGFLALLGMVGAAIMTLAHLDLGVAFLDALGPEGSLPAVAAGFAVGAALYAAVAYAAFARTRWAWPAALAVNGLALLATLGPPRRPGPVEPAAIVVSAVALAILVSPAGRRALRR